MSVPMHLCVCQYVCKFMRKNLYIYETPIYFRNIDYLLIICYRMYTDEDRHMLFNFGQEIPIVKGDHQNGFYSYFGGFKHLVCYNLIVCCSLHPVLVIWYVILVIFGKFNGTFLNYKSKFGICCRFLILLVESCSKLVFFVTEHLVEVVDKLSTTAVVFFRSERILKYKCLYGV